MKWKKMEKPSSTIRWWFQDHPAWHKRKWSSLWSNKCEAYVQAFWSQSVSGLLSTLHDCLNNTYLDVQFGPCSSSEKHFASKHITTFCENFIDTAIFTLDRGYPSMKLVDQLINSKQYFVFRLPSNFLKAYTNQIKAGEDKVINVTFDRVSTNHYRDDIQFRQHLMNTTYSLRFTKLIIEQDKDSQDIVELLSN